MELFPEIERLKNDFERFTIRLSSPFNVLREDLFFVKVSIDAESWEILVDDEYQDFSKTNTLVNWFLVLQSLEIYDEAEDFLIWSKQINIDPTKNNCIEYYKSLDSIYREVKGMLGEIDSCISPYDYTMRTAVLQALLKNN